ncbi:MAG: tRNA uridine-5-carboxymethylaminomethyl(34) synthesis enzyme MnmG [Ruminococcus sp.]|nr:tRNA uridine-5-carboxymethylaminomethyl(34) synthesis enzyme MnmG [Ruminococcus sp.]
MGRVIVVGAGHAGVEAALAAARLGCETLMFSISLDNIANMPCNPSIGGTAKGHLVREIDALGGEMGRAADECFLQSRMLNLSKGAAVHSLRVQADRVRYHTHMKAICENTPGLRVIQGEIVGLKVSDGEVTGVTSAAGVFYPCETVIIATGTYLNGLCHIGEYHVKSGPDNVLPATGLTSSLRELGITVRRFKTGTPARVHKRSIDFSGLTAQKGDDDITPFSFENEGKIFKNIVECFVTYTNEKTHEVIRANLHRSPMFSGIIEGVGPRYCPSIEDKVVRFSDKSRHQIFLEPMGTSTEEYYLQGMSSSLPFDVQEEFIHTIKGLENAEIMRPAYAIEYDCIDPTELNHALQFKSIKGLFSAGQTNGTSGYEEAAAQGLIAGINAARYVFGQAEITLTRDSSYIGTLIDDLVIKGVNDPYRMMTSRSEYRLLLRQDNADERLTHLGHEIGLISDERYTRFLSKMAAVEAEVKRLETTTIAPSDRLNAILTLRGTSPITTGVKLSDLIKRPQICYDDLREVDTGRLDLPKAVVDEASIRIEYAGYINLQLEAAARMRKLEAKKLPEDIDYKDVRGLSLEASEKLPKTAPKTFGEASRISGVSPADLAVLAIYCKG